MGSVLIWQVLVWHLMPSVFVWKEFLLVLFVSLPLLLMKLAFWVYPVLPVLPFCLVLVILFQALIGLLSLLFVKLAFWEFCLVLVVWFQALIERRLLPSSINKEKTFTHRVSHSRRHLIPPNATVDEAHIPDQVSLSTRQYRPSFMPGNEHHQSVF
jgi:hypothetical protein